MSDVWIDIIGYARHWIARCLSDQMPYCDDICRYMERKYMLRKKLSRGRMYFDQYQYDVFDLFRKVRSGQLSYTEIKPVRTDVLFLNLTLNIDRGYGYLEVKIPWHPEQPLILPEDRLKLTNLVDQLRSGNSLMIDNVTRNRRILVRHQLSSRNLAELGIA